MKKHILVYIFFSLMFGLFLSNDLSAQFEKLAVNYDVEEILISDSTYYNVTVSVNNSSGELKYMLLSPTLDLEDLIEESSPTFENTYVFKNLKQGMYYIQIVGENKGGIQTITLGTIKTIDQ